jgi:hypothetical protein
VCNFTAITLTGLHGVVLRHRDNWLALRDRVSIPGRRGFFFFATKSKQDL